MKYAVIVAIFFAAAPAYAGEDASRGWGSSWDFSGPNQQAVDLNAAIVLERMRNGTDGTVTYQSSATVTNVTGGITEVTIDGNGNVVDVKQDGDAGSQSGNATATSNVTNNH